MRVIDLNADVGEWEGESPARAVDRALIPLVTSVNIACGAHAGNESVMAETVALARDHRVAVGAHPGFDDREHFGRREMSIAPADATALVRRQVERLIAIAVREGATVRHVKPHGALYNMAAKNAALADAIAAAVAAIDPRLRLVGLAGSEMIAAGQRVGLRTVAEAFADRGYAEDGSLLPRGTPGAVVHDPAEVAARAVSLVERGFADTLCIHSDTPGAVDLARQVRAALTSAGIEIRA